jgi:hypothetical protein
VQLRTSERIITAVVRSLGGDSETALKPAGATFLCPQTTVLNWCGYVAYKKPDYAHALSRWDTVPVGTC